MIREVIVVALSLKAKLRLLSGIKDLIRNMNL